MESIRAAQYLRMSTERQEYSLVCQSAEIATYAMKYGFDGCQTYSDEAKSGLDSDEEKGCLNCFRMLLAASKIKAVLVYDVSRW